MSVINIVSSEYLPVPAAAAARVTPWVDELSKLGREVRVFTSNASNRARNSTVICSWFALPDNNASLPKRFFQEIFLGFDLGIKIFLRRKKSKLCMITSPPFFMVCICAFFSKLSGIPYVIDMRDRYPHVLAELGLLKTESLPYKILCMIEAWLYREARGVTTVTSGLFNDLEINFPNLNLHLLRNGFDEAVFTNEVMQSKKRDAFTVVYHGRLGRFYELEIYLEIIKLVYESDQSIRFLMVGDLPDRIRINPPKNLKILPAMKLNSLSKMLSSCHLGICILRDLPAMKNAFPAKAYDYIGAGIPLLAGPRGELTQMVDQLNIGITFEQVSPNEVADAIIEIKKKKEDWFRMSANVIKCRNRFGRRKLNHEFFKRELLNY